MRFVNELKESRTREIKENEDKRHIYLPGLSTRGSYKLLTGQGKKGNMLTYGALDAKEIKTTFVEYKLYLLSTIWYF